MLDFHAADGFGHPVGLLQIQNTRATCRNGTKGTGPGADIPQYHEGRGTRSPAFAHIGAITTLTNGMQAVLVHQAPDFAKFGSRRELYPQPRWLALRLLFNH